MRVPSTGQPLYERRIVREGRHVAERMLEGYSTTRNGRLVHETDMRGAPLSGMRAFHGVIQALLGLYDRAARSFR